MTNTLPPETEALVLAVLERIVADRKAAARVPLQPLYAEGDRRTIRSPLDDAKLGTVYRTDPDPTWKVVDPDALAAHLRGDPQNLEHVDEVVGTDEQVLEVLAEHAPHLLARIERVRPDVIEAAVAAARDGGPVAPGIAKVRNHGTLVVRPDKNADAAVSRLVQAGVITWDGTPAISAADAGAVAS